MDITEYEKYLDSGTSSRHPWEIARARIICYLLQKHLPGFHHLTDIGSGDAYLLKYLVPHFPGVQFTAIDQAYTPAILDKILEQAPDEPVSFYKSLDEVKDLPRTTDCFLLLDMLEHCEKDSETLGRILSIRHPTARVSLLITVPAFPGLFSRHDRELGHFRRYEAPALLSLCKEHQLTIIQYGYFFFSLLPARIFQWMAEKANPKRNYHSVSQWNKNKLVTQFITTLLWADFRLCHGLAKLHIKIPGLSLYVLCQI